MRANKYATIFTGIITVASLAMVFILDRFSIFYDIALACFGSALLGFVVAYTGYRAERRAAMEAFWEEAYELVYMIKSFDHLDFDVPKSLVIDALHEEFWDNKQNNRREAFKAWHDDNGSGSFEGKMDECRKKAYGLIDQYRIFADVNVKAMSNAFGRLDFLFGNKTVRDPAYQNIYRRIRDFQDECKKSAYHFDLLKEGQGNLLLSLKNVEDLDAMVFSEKDNMVYRSLYDSLAKDLEDFRSKIYGKKPEYENAGPISGRFGQAAVCDDTLDGDDE